MKKIGAIVGLLALVSCLGAWFLFGDVEPAQDTAVYVIQMQGQKGPSYFLDLAPGLKLTDDLAKAKRFGKKKATCGLPRFNSNWLSATRRQRNERPSSWLQLISGVSLPASTIAFVRILDSLASMRKNQPSFYVHQAAHS